MRLRHRVRHGGTNSTKEVVADMSLALATVAESPPAYEITGTPHAPAVVVLGGISADRHICATEANPEPGWWQCVAGPERPLDASRYRLIGVDYLDGGSEHGRPARIVTTADQADAIAALLDELGIDRAHAIIGASYGGMVALAFAERYPERLERLVVISAAHRAHPMTTALRAIQRRIVVLGLESGRGRQGLVLARALAMTTYRSAREFAARFDSAASSRTRSDAFFPAERYLLHQGDRFADRCTTERFLALSLSSDLHAVEPARITTPAVLVAAESDTNVPRELMEELAVGLGGPCRLLHVATTRGHDAFLTEADALGPILASALAWSPTR